MWEVLEDEYLGIDCLLYRRIGMSSAFADNEKLFLIPRSLNIFVFQAVYENFFSPYPCQNLLFMVFLMIVILTCVRWHIVTLICICQMINDVEHVSHARWPSVCLLWKKMFIQFFCLLLNWALKKYWVEWAIYMFWILTPYWS